jgi:hypothetical protein
MENHRSGPQGYLKMVEMSPDHLDIVIPLSYATDLLKLDNNEGDLKACFFNGALFGIMIARSVLNKEEMRKVPDVIRSIVKDCAKRSENETQRHQTSSDNLVKIANLGLEEAEDYKLELNLIMDQISPVESVDGENYSLLGASFIIHVIKEAKKEVMIEKEIRSAKLTIDGIEAMIGIDEFFRKYY